MDPAIADAVERGEVPPSLSAAHRLLLDYALRLTSDPASCRPEHTALLRAAGLTDEQIHDGVQVAAYFNYINRIASGLGADLEPEMRDDSPGP